MVVEPGGWLPSCCTWVLPPPARPGGALSVFAWQRHGLCTRQASRQQLAAHSPRMGYRFLDQAAAVEPAWGDSKQSDAQEFLRSLLDALHTAHQRKASPARRSLLPARSIDSLVSPHHMPQQTLASRSCPILLGASQSCPPVVGSCASSCGGHDVEDGADDLANVGSKPGADHRGSPRCKQTSTHWPMCTCSHRTPGSGRPGPIGPLAHRLPVFKTDLPCLATAFYPSLHLLFHPPCDSWSRSEAGHVRQAQQAWCAARARQSSLVSDLFEGQLQSSLTCGSCRATCHNFEAFQDLSLPLPEEDGLTIQVQLRR